MNRLWQTYHMADLKKSPHFFLTSIAFCSTEKKVYQTISLFDFLSWNLIFLRHHLLDYCYSQNNAIACDLYGLLSAGLDLQQIP